MSSICGAPTTGWRCHCSAGSAPYGGLAKSKARSAKVGTGFASDRASTKTENFMRIFVAALPLLVCVTPALAAEIPARKAGLWELKMTLEGRGAAMPTVQHCIDAATDKQMNAMGGGNGRAEQCSKKD